MVFLLGNPSRCNLPPFPLPSPPRLQNLQRRQSLSRNIHTSTTSAPRFTTWRQIFQDAESVIDRSIFQIILTLLNATKRKKVLRSCTRFLFNGKEKGKTRLNIQNEYFEYFIGINKLNP